MDSIKTRQITVEESSLRPGTALASNGADGRRLDSRNLARVHVPHKFGLRHYCASLAISTGFRQLAPMRSYGRVSNIGRHPWGRSEFRTRSFGKTLRKVPAHRRVRAASASREVDGVRWREGRPFSRHVPYWSVGLIESVPHAGPVPLSALSRTVTVVVRLIVERDNSGEADHAASSHWRARLCKSGDGRVERNESSDIVLFFVERRS